MLNDNKLRTEESKIEFFVLIPALKHGGGNVIVWGCFTCPWQLAAINSTVNSASYQRALKDNARPSALTLKLSQKCLIIKSASKLPQMEIPNAVSKMSVQGS